MATGQTAENTCCMRTNEGALQPVSITEIAAQSWRLYVKNFSLFVSIAVLGSALGLLEGFIEIFFKTTWWVNWLGLAGAFLSAWASLALIIAASHRHQDKRISIQDAFTAAKETYWRYIGASILYGLFFVAGSLLLIIPGLYWGTIFSLAPIVAALESKQDASSLQVSQSLIRGSFWRVFVIGLIISSLVISALGLFHMLGLDQRAQSLIFIGTGICFGPLFTAISVTLYHRLNRRKEIEPVTTEASSRRSRRIGWVGITGLVVLIVVLVSVWTSILKRFAGTERGAKVLRYVKQQFSPPVAFPLRFVEGVTLDQAEDWLATAILKTEPQYYFEKPQHSTISTFSLQAIPLKTLGFSAAPPSLEDESLGGKLFESVMGKSRWKWYAQTYQSQPIHILTLGNAPWAEYSFQSTRRLTFGSKTTVLKVVYTIVGNHVLTANYWYTLYKISDGAGAGRAHIDPERERQKEANLKQEETEVHDVLAALCFPNESKSE